MNQKKNNIRAWARSGGDELIEWHEAPDDLLLCAVGIDAAFCETMAFALNFYRAHARVVRAVLEIVGEPAVNDAGALRRWARS